MADSRLMQTFRTARRTRRTWLPLVMAALLFAQMLGVLHRVAHAGHAAPVTAFVALDGSLAKALFGDHDDESKCRLYDQLMHADLAVDTAVAIAPLPVAPVEAEQHPAWHLAAQAAGFLARGPPARG